jgi:hypothetical protein
MCVINLGIEVPSKETIAIDTQPFQKSCSAERPMKRVFSLVLVVLSFTFLTLSDSAQTMSHEEEVVRNTYAKLTLLCAVDVLTKNIALSRGDRDKVSQAEIDNKLAAALPTYDLSDFQIGDLSSIGNRPLSDFESVPAEGRHILRISGTAYTYADYSSVYDPVTHWAGMHVKWEDAHSVNAAPLQPMSELGTASVQEIPQSGSKPEPLKRVVYTRYAAYTVNATYQRESTGPYKAFFLFGSDDHGKGYIAAFDLISGEHDNVGLGNMLAEPGYPTGFLQSRLREHPVIANWIRANEMPASSCASVTGDVCCSRGRCGVSQTDLNRELAAPLPQPKVQGGQQ